MRKFKGLTPCAVYEAHHADGTVTRMGFYNEAAKPINYVMGARVCALAGWQNPALQDRLSNSSHQVPASAIFAPRKPADWLGEGSKEIVDGYVIHDGKIVGRDPRMTGPAKYACDSLPDLDNKPKRLTVADLKDLLVRVLREDQAAMTEARKLCA